jgi:hypothetical protein
MVGLALLLGGSASCALVLSYDGYTAEATSTTGSSAGTGTGGGGTSTTTSTSAGAGSTGGGPPGCPDGGLPSIEICGNDVDEDCDGTKCNHVAEWSNRYTDPEPLDAGAPDADELVVDRAVAAVAASGANVAIAGWFNGKLQVGPMASRPDDVPYGREAFVATLLVGDGTTKFLAPAPQTPVGGEARAVALNAAGDQLAVTGFVEAGPINNRDMFVSRYDANNKAWTIPIGGTGSDEGAVIGFDGQSNVLVSGTVAKGTGVLPCNLAASASTPQLVVALLKAADGSCLWARSFPASVIGAQGLLLAPSGQVIVTGFYSGSIAGAGVADSTQSGTFVFALDPSDGKTVWNKAFPVDNAMSSATPTGVAAGGDGRLYLSGRLHGTATIGTNPLSSTNPMQDDALVIALDGSVQGKGDLLWAHRFGGMDGFRRATAIAVAPPAGGVDDIFVAGIAGGAISVKPDSDVGVLCPIGGVFLLKMHGESPVWGDCFGEAGAESIEVVHMVRSVDHLVLAGGRKLPINFGAGLLKGKPTSNGDTFDAFVARFPSL